MSAYLPAGVSQSAIDEAINGDPDRAETEQPPDVLDCICYASYALTLACSEMPDKRWVHLRAAREFCERAAVMAERESGEGEVEVCPI
jgi:hypothetical protein